MSVFQPSLSVHIDPTFPNLFQSESATASGGLGQACNALRTRITEGAGIHSIELALRKITGALHRSLLDGLRHLFESIDASLVGSFCPHCSHPTWRNRLESLTIQFLEGQLRLSRWYVECRPCRIRFHPLDLWLGLPDLGEFAPQFSQDLCLLAIHLPSQTAVDVLAAVTGRTVGRVALQQEVSRAGNALVQLETEEAKSLWPWDDQRRMRQIEPPRGAPLRTTPPAGDTLVVEMDGVFANIGREPSIIQDFKDHEALVKSLSERGEPPPSHTPSRFREVRQARLYRLEDRVTKKTRSGKTRTSLERSETVSVVNDPAMFEQRVQAVASAWQADQYRCVLAIGDGGPFLWDVAKTLLKPNYEILDIQHLRSHVHAGGKAVFGETTKEATAWSRKWCHHVFDHGPDDLIVELHALQQRPLADTAARVLKNLIDYITTHKHRLAYPTFRKLGFPIASGAIESANRQVVGDRCKRSGMRWTRAGLQRMVSLRAAFLSGNWTKAFEAIRLKLARSFPQPLTEETTGPTSPPDRNPSPAIRKLASTPVTASPKPLRMVSPRKALRLIQSGILARTTDGQLAPVHQA